MKTALIATLAVLGSTTAALAAPVRHETVDVRPVVQEQVRTTVTVGTRTNPRPVIQQPVVVDRHRGERGHGPVIHQPEPRPVVVTRPVITHPIVISQPVYTPPPVYTQPVYSPPIYQPSTLTLANDVQLYGAQFINIDRSLQKLTLSADSGTTDIQAIQITFANGDIKTFNYNEMLDRSNPSLTMNLGGRNVDNIVVFGHAQSWGAQLDVTAGC